MQKKLFYMHDFYYLLQYMTERTQKYERIPLVTSLCSPCIYLASSPCTSLCVDSIYYAMISYIIDDCAKFNFKYFLNVFCSENSKIITVFQSDK